MNTTQYLRIFKSIRLYFSQGYDIHKYGMSGVKTSRKEFDKYSRFLNKALTQFKPNEFIEYIVANIVYDTPLEDIIRLNMSTYNKWKGNISRLTSVVEDDIIDIKEGFLEPHQLEFESLFKCSEGEHPYIFKMYLSNDIHKETVIILNDMIGFFDVFDECMEEDFIWQDEKIRLEKYGSFLHYDKQLMMKRIYSVIRDERS